MIEVIYIKYGFAVIEVNQEIYHVRCSIVLSDDTLILAKI